MSKILKISLSSVKDVKKFVNLIEKIQGDVTIRSGKYVIDAKSIMGIFSLGLSKIMELEVSEWKDSYEKSLKAYIAD